MAALNAARPASSPTFSLEVTNVTDRGKWGTHTTLIIRFGKSENAVPKPRNNKLLILTKLLMVMNLLGHNYPILTVAIVTQQINSLTPGDRWVRLNTPYIYIYMVPPRKTESSTVDELSVKRKTSRFVFLHPSHTYHKWRPRVPQTIGTKGDPVRWRQIRRAQSLNIWLRLMLRQWLLSSSRL